MPYELEKEAGKPLFTVVTKATGKKHSNKPIPKKKAEAQKRILESAEGLEGGKLPTDAELDKMTKPQLLATARIVPYINGLKVSDKRDVTLSKVKAQIAERIAKFGREKVEANWDRNEAEWGEYNKKEKGLVAPNLSYTVDIHDYTKGLIPIPIGQEVRHKSISSFLLPQLKALAKEKGLKGYATMKKADLIAALSPLVGESKAAYDPHSWFKPLKVEQLWPIYEDFVKKNPTVIQYPLTKTYGKQKYKIEEHIVKYNIPNPNAAAAAPAPAPAAAPKVKKAKKEKAEVAPPPPPPPQVISQLRASAPEFVPKAESASPPPRAAAKPPKPPKAPKAPKAPVAKSAKILLPELKQMAKARGIKGFSTMKKGELEKALKIKKPMKGKGLEGCGTEDKYKTVSYPLDKSMSKEQLQNFWKKYDFVGYSTKNKPVLIEEGNEKYLKLHPQASAAAAPAPAAAPEKEEEGFDKLDVSELKKIIRSWAAFNNKKVSIPRDISKERILEWMTSKKVSRIGKDEKMAAIEKSKAASDAAIEANKKKKAAAAADIAPPAAPAPAPPPAVQERAAEIAQREKEEPSSKPASKLFYGSTHGFLTDEEAKALGLDPNNRRKGTNVFGFHSTPASKSNLDKLNEEIDRIKMRAGGDEVAVSDMRQMAAAFPTSKSISIAEKKAEDTYQAFIKHKREDDESYGDLTYKDDDTNYRLGRLVVWTQRDLPDYDKAEVENYIISMVKGWARFKGVEDWTPGSGYKSGKEAMGDMEKAAAPPAVQAQEEEMDAPSSDRAGDADWKEIMVRYKKAQKMIADGYDSSQITHFWNTSILPKLKLYGAEYMESGAMAERSEEMWESLIEEYEARKNPKKATEALEEKKRYTATLAKESQKQHDELMKQLDELEEKHSAEQQALVARQIKEKTELGNRIREMKDAVAKYSSQLTGSGLVGAGYHEDDEEESEEEEVHHPRMLEIRNNERLNRLGAARKEVKEAPKPMMGKGLYGNSRLCGSGVSNAFNVFLSRLSD